MKDSVEVPEFAGRRRRFSLFGTGIFAQPAPADLPDHGARVALLGQDPSPMLASARMWDSLPRAAISDIALIENGLFPVCSKAPVVAAFDMLRTRILHGQAKAGWRRIAVSSPSRACGTTFVAANLALSFARRPEGRCVLLDLDLRRPALARRLCAQSEVAEGGDLMACLTGGRGLAEGLVRRGDGLALGLNARARADAPGLLQNPDLHHALDRITDLLAPDVVLYDLPPALEGDDLLALAGQIDAVLLVVDGTRTTAADIRRCEAHLAGVLPIAGIVMNRAQDLGPGPGKGRA